MKYSSNPLELIRKLISNLLILIVIFPFIGAIPLSKETSSWHIEIVDPIGILEGTSITLDSCDKVHISYPNEDGDLKWVKRTGTTWYSETVDPSSNPMDGTSIAIDQNGNPHISYTGFYDLKYAKRLGPSFWSIQTLGIGAYGDGCMQSSIALDSNNRPHIIFHDSGSFTLNYTYWTGTMWDNSTIDTNYEGYSSITLDSNDNIHISYSSPDGLKYANWTGSSWYTELVDPSATPKHSSIAVDSNDSPRIAYHDYSSNVLKHAQIIKSSWYTYSVETIEGAGWFPSIDINSADNSTISYADMAKGQVKYAVGHSDTWQNETVEAAIYPRYTSIAIDSDDNPHISYFDLYHLEVKYAGIADQVHDFVVLGSTLSKTIVGQGYNVVVNATLLNNSSNTETLNLTLYANKTFVMSRSFSMESGESTISNLIWATDSIVKGEFIIEVTVAVHPCETSFEDNSFTAGSLLVTLPGDVDGDKDVDIFDIVNIAGVYGLIQSDPNYEVNNDIDGDGEIDIFDIVAAASHYGESW